MPPKGKGAKVRTIFTAAEDGDFAGIQERLTADPTVHAQRNADGWTPLHMAAYNGHEDAVDALLKGGADVNAKCNDGDTPIHYASAQGAQEAIKRLAKAPGIKLEVTDNDGETPADVAQNPKTRKLLEQLIAAAEVAGEGEGAEGEGEEGE